MGTENPFIETENARLPKEVSYLELTPRPKWISHIRNCWKLLTVKPNTKCNANCRFHNTIAEFLESNCDMCVAYGSFCLVNVAKAFGEDSVQSGVVLSQTNITDRPVSFIRSNNVPILAPSGAINFGFSQQFKKGSFMC